MPYNEKICALTFDDGPSEITPLVLDVLEKYGATASFFIVGHNVYRKPENADVMRRAVAQGCTIENHSYAHKNLRGMDYDDMLASFYAVQYLVKKETGEEPIFFRAPGGGGTEDAYKGIPLPFMIGDCGSADWNSREDDPVTSDLETRIKGIVNIAHDGHIMLMHDNAGNHLTPKALDAALDILTKEGFRFVNLRELFRIKGITPKAGECRQWVDVYNPETGEPTFRA